MWGFAVIIALVSVGVSLGHDEKCLDKALEAECNTLDHASDEVPTNARGLDKFCQIVTGSFNCILNEYKTCSEDKRFEDFIEKLAQFADRSCNPESEIYQVILNNLQCITSDMNLMGNLCRTNGTAQFMLQKRKVLEERNISLSCQYSVYHTTCESLMLWEKCGEDVGHAVLDILMNLDYDLTVCPEDVVSEIPEIANAVILIRQIEREIDNDTEKK